MRLTESASFQLHILLVVTGQFARAQCFELVEMLSITRCWGGSRWCLASTDIQPQWLTWYHWWKSYQSLVALLDINTNKSKQLPRHTKTTHSNTRWSHTFEGRHSRDGSLCPIKSHRTCCGTCYGCTGHFSLYRDACINGLGLCRHRGQSKVEQE